MRPRTSSRFSLLAASIATVLTTALPAPAMATADRTPPHQRAHEASSHAMGWYLALGDSLATGYQPDGGEERAGGYVGLVLDALRNEQSKTKLVNLACYGESTVTMVDGSHCTGDYEEGSQLAQAVKFLHAHARRTRLVTLTLGSNDITPCLSQQDVTGCAAGRLEQIYRNLTTILAALHTTAPQVPIVVTNYYNPYLALVFDPARSALVPLTTELQKQLNATLVAATTAGTGGTGEVADVAAQFRSYDDATTANGVPVNVATICVYTWMCSWTPPNIHPTDLGYDAMAEAIIENLWPS